VSNLDVKLAILCKAERRLNKNELLTARLVGFEATKAMKFSLEDWNGNCSVIKVAPSLSQRLSGATAGFHSPITNRKNDK
jgi:hypothetical protein